MNIPQKLSKYGFRRAGAEFLVIFAGVSLGLVADDWRQHRNDTAAGNEILGLIHADLAYDSTEMASLRDPLASHVRWSAWIQRNWDSPDVRLDSLGRGFYQFLFTNTPQLRGSAYATLKNGNRLALIRDPALRSDIVRYYDETHVRLNQYLTYHFQVRDRLLRTLDRHVRYPGPESRSMAIVSRWSDLRADNATYNQATEIGVIARLAVRYLDRAQEENRQLRLAIETALHQRSRRMD